MKQKKNSNETKDRNRSSSGEKTKKPLIPKENFNTGSHTPLSLRNVGAGYDDTGMGDYENDNETNDENVNKRQNRKNRKSRQE